MSASTLARSHKVLHLDIDTTVEPLFGEQIEGALKGPNPRYRGRVSYDPIVARIAEVNAVVGARLRPGDTAFGNDDVPWLKGVIESVRKAVGPDVVIVVWIDTAGDAVEVLRAIDQLGCLFVIKARPDESAELYPVRDPHGDDGAALLAGERALWWAPRPT